MDRPSDSRTIVFDLDGTLVDTAPDLIVGVNFVLRQVCGGEIADDVLRPAISFGGRWVGPLATGTDIELRLATVPNEIDTDIEAGSLHLMDEAAPKHGDARRVLIFGASVATGTGNPSVSGGGEGWATRLRAALEPLVEAGGRQL